MCLLYTADQTCRGSFQRQEFWRNRVRRAMRLVSYRTDATHSFAYNIYGYRNLFTLILTTSLSHVFNDVVHIRYWLSAVLYCVAASNRCNACKLVWYCSQQCQTTDWPRHKTECEDKPTQGHQGTPAPGTGDHKYEVAWLLLMGFNV